MSKARMGFKSFTVKDRVAWNMIISCYIQNGFVEESIDIHREMRLLVDTNGVTYSGIISSLSRSDKFDEAVAVFQELLDLGSREMRLLVDTNGVTYSGIISSLSRSDKFDEAVAVFQELLDLGLKPDVVAIANILPAARFGEFCKEIHGYAYKNELESDRRLRSALISVYGKCGLIRYAERVFHRIESRDVISWNSMVVGYAHNRYFIEVLDTFRQMTRSTVEPNPITITGMIMASADVSGLALGKELHLWAIRNSFDVQTFIGCAILDMYVKCGRIPELSELDERDRLEEIPKAG